MVKNCPFCGEQPKVHCWHELIHDYYFYSVECKNKQCTIQPKTLKEYKSRAAAVRAWNKKGD